MSDSRSTFETTKSRLEDIVTQVRRKDVSLEASLDLLEEAVRLVNQCNDLIDQTSWRAPQAPADEATDTSISGPAEGDANVPGAVQDDEDRRPADVEPDRPAGDGSTPTGMDPTEAEPVGEIEDDARE